MKTEDLTDYVVVQDNTQLAFDTLSECMDKTEFLILMFHAGMKWYCPRKSTKDMVSNVATLLMDENFSHTYLKYAN